MPNHSEILCCSAGHIYDPKDISHVWWKGERKDGGNCPEVLSYDRMTGTKKCGRRLFNLEQRIDEICQRLNTKRIIPPDGWAVFEIPEIGEKEIVEKYLREGCKIKAGIFVTRTKSGGGFEKMRVLAVKKI